MEVISQVSQLTSDKFLKGKLSDRERGIYDSLTLNNYIGVFSPFHNIPKSALRSSQAAVPMVVTNTQSTKQCQGLWEMIRSTLIEKGKKCIE